MIRQSPFPLSRRRFAFGSLFLLGGLLAGSGCAQQEPTPGASASPGAASPQASASPATGTATAGFKVGLLTVGKISDKGWSQSAYDGLQKVKTETGADTAQPVEEPQLAQVESVLRDQATQGASLVFGNASEWDGAAKSLSGEFPKTTFSIVGGKSSGANLVPIQLQANQACYLAGMLAGGMTKTGKVGLVGGVEIPIIKQAFGAFAAGAKSVRPDVQVKTTFTGSFSDAARAKQQAQALLESGADVVMHNANDAGVGVFQAVSEKPGAMAIGANANQSDQATTQNLGSFILDVPAAMVAVARQVKDGKTDGKPFKAGLKDKAVGFVFNPGFKGTVPAALKAKMAQAETAMIAGTLDPNK